MGGGVKFGDETSFPRPLSMLGPLTSEVIVFDDLRLFLALLYKE
jgi:hypothetical protein